MFIYQCAVTLVLPVSVWMFSYLNFTENSQNFIKLEVFFKKPDLVPFHSLAFIFGGKTCIVIMEDIKTEYLGYFLPQNAVLPSL